MCRFKYYAIFIKIKQLYRFSMSYSFNAMSLPKSSLIKKRITI